MNQGRIWTVVNPSVGLPLFLGSVAVTSLIVHSAVLNNTTWFAGFMNGHGKAKAASVESATQPVALNSSSGVNISVAPVTANASTGETSFVITLSPKAAVADASTAQTSAKLALATPTTK